MSIAKELRSILGEAGVVSDESELPKFSIDGITPKAVLYPDNEEQISEVMKLATRESVPVVPIGSLTKRGLGNIPIELSVLLSTRNLNRVLEHESRDLVATSECGITIEDLQNTLGKEGQFLPIDTMHTDSGATLGGVIASNSSGPLRLRYGTLRELIIGIKVIRSDGSVFRGGSKVVKNVAGYDLPKLFVGSLGTLGIITEATMRLYPVSELSETYLVSFTTLEKCTDTVSKLLKSELALNSLELMNPALVKELTEQSGIELKRKKYALAIRVMNVGKAVGEQMVLVKKICNKNRGQGVLLEGDKENKFWDGVINCLWSGQDEARVKLKAGAVITQVPGIFAKLEEITQNSDIKAYGSARAGNGVVDIMLQGDSKSMTTLITKLRKYCEQSGGSLVIEDAPIEVKQEIDVWGDIGSALSIMKRIKSNFDPMSILNPGRFI